MIPTKEAAKSINMPFVSFNKYAVVLDLNARTIGKNRYWTNEQIKKVSDFRDLKKKPKTEKIKKEIKAKVIPNSDKKISIIEYFKGSINNDTTTLSKLFNLSVYQISTIIGEYLNTGCVIVDSKLNHN